MRQSIPKVYGRRRQVVDGWYGGWIAGLLV